MDIKIIEKIRKAQLGKPRPFTTGRKNGMWKGKNASYSAIHHWVKKHFQHSNKCEICKIPKEKKRFSWANKNHKYTRNKKDWLYLCYSCHAKYDIEHSNRHHYSFNSNNTFTQRQCSICREIFPLTIDFFHRSKGHALGFKYVCKKCRSRKKIIQ